MVQLSPPPQKDGFLSVFFCVVGSVVQSVASRVTCLWSVDVCSANPCLCPMIVFENRIFSPHLPKPTISDCIDLPSVASQLPTFHLLQTPNISFCLKKNSENYNFQALKFNYFSYLYSDIYSMLRDGEENCRKIARRSGLSR